MSRRREPTLEAPSGPDALHIRPDRRGGAQHRNGRVEPSLGTAGAWIELTASQRETATPTAGPAAVASSRKQQSKAASRKPRKRRSFLRRLVYWGVVLGVWGVVAIGAVVAFYATQLPPIDQLAVPKRPPNIAILAEDGSLLANRGDTGGAAVALRDLPSYLPKAFVAIEDRRFYSHMGIDPFGILRAAFRNISGRAVAQGGSTLTQQLAKNLFLTQERTLSRKIQEAILALWLEHKYSKDQILELYLNRVYFGSGAYGVEAAAQKYYGKSARSVTLAEAAVLAGLMKSPSRLAPNRNPQAAADRAAQVLEAMRQEGFITDAMAKAALARPAQVVHEKGSGSANYAADYVVDALDDIVGPIDQDIAVTTTFSPALQNAAERALDEELAAKGQKFGVSQGAFVALDPAGGIKALVGGRDYADSQFDRAVTAKRQPGSSFKPFVYLTALEHGLTPDTVREDRPLNIRGWQPENSTREYRGPVTLTQALALSINTVAVQLGLEVGPKNVVKTAHRLGIQSELTPNASIALGTSEVTPLELVTAYAAFANGGIGVQAHAIVKVTTTKGKLLYQRKGSSFGRLIDEQNVAMMNSMLRETLRIGTARKADLPNWDAAGKTGTSQEYRDSWFIGYTSHLVAGVWLGNDDGSPTKKSSGGNLPVEIWSRFMKVAHQGVPPADLPGGSWNGTGPAVATRTPAEVPMPDAEPLFPTPGVQARAPESGEPPLRGLRPRPATDEDYDAPLPPASIPTGPPTAEDNQPGPARFFERLFGG